MDESSSNNNAGPNQIRPTTEIMTARPDGCVRLRIPQSGKAIECIDPISVPGLLYRTAKEFPNHVALATKKNGSWEKITYKQYETSVRTCAKAFISLGLERYHSVCILGFNCPEWFISNVGAIYAGGFAAGIYTTNSAEACFYCAESSRANIVVVEDVKQLEKILQVKDRLPDLKKIVLYNGTSDSSDVISWTDLMELGKKESDERLDATLKSIAVNECCTLVYTSGTVGNPKAVMLSHDNLTWDALSIGERIGLNRGTERVVSYLPLSHVAAQVVDIYLTMSSGAAVYFADKDALKGSLLNSLLEIHPTKFLAVPRVWEKMYEKMQQVAASNKGLKKSMADWAKRHTLEHYMDKLNGKDSNTWGFCLASMLLNKIKQALGFSKCGLFVSAAAPLAPDVKRYFLSIGIPIMDAFGMSEASGAHTLSHIECFGLDSIGPTLPGMKTKLHEPNAEGHGELCMSGRHIFMGYLGEPEKTADALDEEGWLHSGDVGRIDGKGLVYITGRIKELLITAGGENVPPVPIEQQFLAQLPHVSNCILIGDKMKFLSMLLTLKTNVNPDTAEPKDTLTKETKEWLKSLGVNAETVTDVLATGPDSKLLDALNEAREKVNKNATSNAQKIQKIAILPKDFSVPGGELGPTLKLKRNVVVQKYSDVIEKLYK